MTDTKKYIFGICAYEDASSGWDYEEYETREAAEQAGRKEHAGYDPADDGLKLFVGEIAPILDHLGFDATTFGEEIVNILDNLANEKINLEEYEPVFCLSKEKAEQLGRMVLGFVRKHNEVNPRDLIINIQEVKL